MYMVKSAGAEELFRTIRRAVENDALRSQSALVLAKDEPNEPRANDAIAVRLGVSVNTVKTHVRGVLRKLKAETRTAAVSRAMELGIVLPHERRG